MPTLKENISEDLKEAMRAKDGFTLQVLRMLAGAIKNKEIQLRDQSDVSLTDEQVVEVVSSEVKKRKDSIEAYLAGGRQDLADKEEREVGILEHYLPEQLSDEEIERIVRETAEASEAKDFGRIMGQAMAKLKGKADGKKVGEMVKKVLGQ